MFCVYCGKELKAGTAACEGCGKSLRERLLKCRNCGYQAIEGDRFCLRCSTEIEYMFVDKKDAGPTYAAPKTTYVKAETGHVLHVHEPPRTEDASPEARHAPYVLEPLAVIEEVTEKTEKVNFEKEPAYMFDAPKHEEVKPAESASKPFLDPSDHVGYPHLAAHLMPAQDDEPKKLVGKPRRWGKFVAVWLIFLVIAGGGGFAAFWYYDDIMSFFRTDNYSPPIVAEYDFETHQIVLPFDILEFDEEPPYEPEPEPEPQAQLPIIRTSTIAAGQGHYLAICQDGHLWSWGANASGQLGVGSTDDHMLPVRVMDDAISVHASHDRTIVITEEGNLWSFGSNERGQLGDGSTTNRHLPVLVMENVVFASITDDTSFAITDDNIFWAWGANDEGQLGDGTTTDRHSPTFIRDDGLEFAMEIGLIGNFPVWEGENLAIDGEQIVYISANPNVSLVLTEGGYVWGYIGDALEAVRRWDEDDFFIILADVKLPISEIP